MWRLGEIVRLDYLVREFLVAIPDLNRTFALSNTSLGVSTRDNVVICRFYPSPAFLFPEDLPLWLAETTVGD